MNIQRNMPDSVVIDELAKRIVKLRLNANITQSRLAKEAGISLQTLQRLESGKTTSLTNFIRIMRALDILENLDATIPEQHTSPMSLLKMQGKTRVRASGSRKKDDDNKSSWSWG